MFRKTLDAMKNIPTPSELLAEVKSLPPKVNGRSMAKYGETIRVLRDEKYFTFEEIRKWLNENAGFDFHTASISNAYYNLRRLSPLSKCCNAPMRIMGLTTHWYECTACNQPTDPKKVQKNP